MENVGYEGLWKVTSNLSKDNCIPMVLTCLMDENDVGLVRITGGCHTLLSHGLVNWHMPCTFCLLITHKPQAVHRRKCIEDGEVQKEICVCRKQFIFDDDVRLSG